MATKNEKSLTPAQKGRITRLSQKNTRELATKVVLLTDELALTQTKLHNSKCANNSLRDEGKAKDVNIVRLKNNVEILEKRNEELKAKINYNETDIKNYREEVDKLNQSIKTLNDRIDNYKKIINSNNISFKSYKEEIERYKDKLKDLTSSLLKVNEKNEIANKQLDDLTKHNKAIYTKYCYLESKHNFTKKCNLAAGIIILIGLFTIIFL